MRPEQADETAASQPVDHGLGSNASGSLREVTVLPKEIKDSLRARALTGSALANGHTTPPQVTENGARTPTTERSGSQSGAAGGTDGGPPPAGTGPGSSHAEELKDHGAVISITEERENVNSSPIAPAFLHGNVFANVSRDDWGNIVLPYVASLTFIIESTTDVHYFADIMKAGYHLPNIHLAVKKIHAPNFFWFSGTNANRKHNPFLSITAMFPHLEELFLTFHTAGLTTGVWSERERIRMEEDDLEKSKELRALNVDEIVRKYDLIALYKHRNLRYLRLECISSESVKFHCKTGDPMEVFSLLRDWVEAHLRIKIHPAVVVSARLVERD